MNIPHTPEDAAILRRTDPGYRTWSADFNDLCKMIAHARCRATGRHSFPVMRRCLAADGYSGKEWLDLMDELAGRVAA